MTENLQSCRFVIDFEMTKIAYAALMNYYHIETVL